MHDDSDDLARFMAKVYVPLGDDAACWTWTASGDGRGYGQFRFQGSLVRAHRWSYEHFIGAIPEGFEIDHLCRNRGCVNPAHLEPVTHAENNQRSWLATGPRPRRPMRPKTHCKYGHEFTPENTYIKMTSGGRDCRKCRLRRKAERRARGIPRSKA